MRFLRFVLLAMTVACEPSVRPSDPLNGLNATVEFVNIEGGCWTLRADPQTRYLPTNLSDEFRVDGKQVRVTLQTRDTPNVCQIGRVVSIVSISAR